MLIPLLMTDVCHVYSLYSLSMGLLKGKTPESFLPRASNIIQRQWKGNDLPSTTLKG
jgi:hypothetical protein